MDDLGEGMATGFVLIILAIVCYISAIRIAIFIQFNVIENGFLIPLDTMVMFSIVLAICLFIAIILLYRLTLSSYRSGVIGVSIRRFRLLLIQIYNHIKNSYYTRVSGGSDTSSKNLTSGERL